MSLEAFAKVSEATKLLVEQGFTAESVTASIELVGRALGVDRMLVYENPTVMRPGLRLSPLRHTWSDKPLSDSVRQAFPLHEHAPGWVEILSRGQPMWELSRNAPGPLRMMLEAQKVKSVLLCPISMGSMNGAWWGTLRLDDCQKERQWTEELVVLKTLTRSMSNALKQDQRRVALKETRTQLQLMMLRTAAAGTR
jgi:GAF domain-containing protein